MPIFVYILFIISFCTSLCAKDINHPADINKNWIIEIKEFNDYNEAWRKNIQWQTLPYTIPKDYVTRCGFLLNYGGVYYYSEEQPPLCWKAGQKPFVNSLGMSFVYVTPGSFIMGSPEDEINRDPDEKQHHVQLTHTVLIQTTEVTQKQWAIVMGSNPSYFEHCGENCPVEMVSWNDVQLFIEKINAMENNKYRLPTEAEWEYSARAGSISAYYWGNRADCQSMMYENNAETSENFCVDHFSLSNLNPTSTAPVQSFDTNNWNLFDMHGNVWEWCHDWFAAYSSSPVTDPSGPLKGNYKVIRGGAWNSNAAICRSAYRGYASPENRYNYIGFRLVCLSLAKKQNNISIGETLQSTFINRVGINLETRIISSTNCPNAITVNINGNETLSSIAIEEYLPHDITPTQIYQNGIFCPETHSIRWGAFLSNNQRMMTYNVTGPVSTYKIEGNTSINGKSRTITGENELIPRQCSSIINPLLNIITIHLPETECGDYYEKQINASGGHKPLTFSMVKGNLPTGLSLNNENGMISGNSSSTGSFVFSIGVSDRSGDYVEREFAINVVLPLTITTHSMLPHGTKNVSYFENIIISGSTLYNN
jgi:formylglycine-generating enzyme required for sulfatase activity